MMDLTPLDVRKKKGDFRKGLRGYEAAQVDDFLDLVADRLEALVRAASTVDERIARLEQQVSDYRDREKALTEALVTAQQMREDIRTQSTREVELLRKQAEQEAERIHADAVRRRAHEEQALEGLRARQFQFIASYQKYLESELAELEAMVKSLRMHSGGARHAGPTAAPAAALPSTPFPGVSTPSPQAASPAGPPAAVETADSGSADSAPAVPEASAPAAVEPAPDTVSTTPVPQQDPEDSIESSEDEPLEDALARWEPELGDAEPPVAVDEAEDEAETPESDGIAVESEDDVDLAFLEFGEDDVADAPEPAQARSVDTEQVQQEVDAAMVESDSTFIDLGTALGDEPDDFEPNDIELDEVEAPVAEVAEAEVAAPEPVVAETPAEVRDEMDDMIDAAFAFGEVADEAVDDQAVPELVLEEEDEAASGRDSDIEFVDALLMDSGAFGEAPEDEPVVEAVAEEVAESVEDGAPAAPHAEMESERPESDEKGDLIDLESFQLSESGAPAPPRADVSSLTLHPLFFEEESPQSASEEDEAARQDQWSSSGGG